MILLLGGILVYDFHLFQYYAPRDVGNHWFREACKIVGLTECYVPGGFAERYVPGGFSEDTQSHVLKVSTVRHPCDWFRLGFYTTNRDKGNASITFASFVEQYLQNQPGELSRRFDQYQADTVLRVEDLPWAFLELMEMLGCPETQRKRLEDHPISPTFTPPIEWDPILRKQFMESERDLCERYDYF